MLRSRRAGGLRNLNSSVCDLVDRLDSQQGGAGVERRAAAAGLDVVISKSPSAGAVEGAVKRLQHGRIPGPGRLWGELLRGLYEFVPIYDAEHDRLCDSMCTIAQQRLCPA